MHRNRTEGLGSDGPEPDSCTAAKPVFHSITWWEMNPGSAQPRANNQFRMVRPHRGTGFSRPLYECENHPRRIKGLAASVSPMDEPNLEHDLSRDRAFREALRDDRFARAVYTVFSNRTFSKGSDERAWYCSDWKAVHLVVTIRGVGDNNFSEEFLPGVWPDDRAEREAFIHKSIEEASKPWSFDNVLDTVTKQQQSTQNVEWLRSYFETHREEFERRLPEMEAERRLRLELSQRMLADLDQNSEVFEALHAHLSRLGWRTVR